MIHGYLKYLKKRLFDFIILRGNMSIPGKQKHHSDIALDLMKIRLIFTVRFRISPFGIKWSIDISNVNSLGRGWKELLMAKETVIYCMGLLFKAHVMQKNWDHSWNIEISNVLGKKSDIRFYREIPTFLSWFNSNHLIGDDGNNSKQFGITWTIDIPNVVWKRKWY